MEADESSAFKDDRRDNLDRCNLLRLNLDSRPHKLPTIPGEILGFPDNAVGDLRGSGGVGVFLGCIIANCFPVGYPPNIIDVVFGSFANIISGYVVLALTKRYSRIRLVIASLISSLIVTFIVGTYLPIIILPEFTIKDILFLGYLGVLPGELVSQTILGVWLVEGIRRLLPKKMIK